MADEIDLTNLTPQERSHLLSVVQRARKVDEVYRTTPKHGKDRDVTPDDIMRKKWKENQGNKAEKPSYVPAFEALSVALNGEVSSISSNSQEPCGKRDTFNRNIPPFPLRPDSSDEETTSSSSMGSPRRPPNWDSSDTTSSDSMMSRPRTRSGSRPRYIRVYPSVSREEVDDVGNQNLSPLSAQSRRHSDALGRGSLDRRSYPTLYSSRVSICERKDQVGTIDISLTYFPPSDVKHKTFPSKGTRFPENQTLDVLTRKTYAMRSGAKISISKDRKSGARLEEDGELHLLVKGANELNLPSAIRPRAKTYVKCYMLPDRYHGSKMKSEVQKETHSPRYNHKFVFRGFSEEEFNERSIEVIIGGVTSSRGRHPVVGGIRLSNGVHDPSSKLSWKNPLTDEFNIWRKAFETPSTEISASVTLRLKIKMTYK